MTMAEPLTWIRLNRNITTWRHWKNHRIAIVFIWMIVKAQYGEGSVIGSTVINRGELATSMDRIAAENGLTYQQVRDVIDVLKRTGEISTRRCQKCLIIKIENYEKYQPLEGCAEQSENNQGTIREQSKTKQRTIREQHYKNIYKYRKGEETEKGDASLRPFPCGTAVKPEWMDDDLWDDVRYRVVDDIPAREQGDYESYIEYAEECHRQGREIK